MKLGRLVIMLLLMSCASHDDTIIPTIQDYYPIKVGATYYYEVDSTVTVSNVASSYKYTLRVVISDSFPNDDGSISYALQRSKRTGVASPWIQLPTWSVRRTTNQLIENEGNIAFLKILAPISNGNAWNGNTYNDLQGTERCVSGLSNTCDIYTAKISDDAPPGYDDPVLPIYKQTLSVIENDFQDDITGKDIRLSMYSKKFGLIYRSVVQLTYCTSEAQGCIGQKEVLTGLEYNQTLSSYEGL